MKVKIVKHITTTSQPKSIGDKDSVKRKRSEERKGEMGSIGRNFDFSTKYMVLSYIDKYIPEKDLIYLIKPPIQRALLSPIRLQDRKVK